MGSMYGTSFRGFYIDISTANFNDRFCGLVVSVPGCRFRDPWFDFLRYQIF
jgi:hypothetical protein